MPPEDEDADRVAALASRTDPARFAEVFERRGREIHRYVSFRAGAAVAEELTAETFARAFATRQRFDPVRGSVRAWLYGIATNVVRLHHRAERRKRAAYAREADSLGAPSEPDDPENRLADRQWVTAALAQLDPHVQDVVYLLGAVCLSYDEAAVALGIPVGTVRSRYSRGRARMSELLARSAPANPDGTVPRRRPS
jgi:RNA polymerase sigma factor (sigma-70 family)